MKRFDCEIDIRSICFGYDEFNTFLKLKFSQIIFLMFHYPQFYLLSHGHASNNTQVLKNISKHMLGLSDYSLKLQTLNQSFV